MTWRDEQDEILRTVTGDAGAHKEFDSELYTEESLGYTKSFLQSISDSYGGIDGGSDAEESVLYQHHDGRHVWASYNPGSVTFRGDEITVGRCEDILTSDNPKVAYFRNRAAEGGSQVSSALKNFGGLFED